MEKTDQSQSVRFSRRVFIQQGTLFLAGSTLVGSEVSGFADAEPKVRIGLVTDLHYADKPPAGTRHYRETPAKLAEAAKRFKQEEVDLVVALGDVIDSAESLEAEKGYLRRIAKEFVAMSGQHRYVLGNHCVSALTKPEFLEIVGQKASFYSFDLKGVHFVVLDACFRSDGTPYGRKNFKWADANLSPAEIEWLRTDLKKTPYNTVVFVHQRLDFFPPYGVWNASDVRKVLEASGKVLAVMQGHDHKGGYQEIGGVHYVTLAAMVEGSGPENNAYAVMDVLPNDGIRIRGFHKQKSYDPL
jgi:alkaline phosphatase